MSQDARFGKRKTVNMNEDIAQELNRLANLQGKTLYSLVNEIGLQTLEANKAGSNLEDAVTAKKLLHSARRSRMVLVNQDLWYFASSQAFKSFKNKWLKLIRDTAQWQANVYLTQPGDPEFVESVRRLIADFYWDCGEAEVEDTNGGEGLVVRLAFVPEMPLDHTEGLSKAFEGIFNARGYVATESTVQAGYLAMTFKRVGGTVSVK